LIRVPSFKPGHESSVRIEYRAPDPACNPYLTFAVMLAAGFKGIEDEYPPPTPVEGNVFSMSQEERQARNIQTLPGSMGEAIGLAEGSDLLRTALGEHIFDSFIRNKKLEWEDYRGKVSEYEVSRYLPLL
jgi:glutamine synthetase